MVENFNLCILIPSYETALLIFYVWAGCKMCFGYPTNSECTSVHIQVCRHWSQAPSGGQNYYDANLFDMSRFIAILNDINVLYTNSSLQVAVEAEGRRFKSLGPPPGFSEHSSLQKCSGKQPSTCGRRSDGGWNYLTHKWCLLTPAWKKTTANIRSQRIAICDCNCM
jgi:hypothetical protein